MVTFLIGALTVVLVLNSLFLILLVLVQLPKKEAGIGMAFGGAATETLFGAGTGSVLTRATKYSAGLFMGLSLLLAVMNSTVTRKAGAQLDEELQRLATTGAGPAISAPDTTNAAPPLSPAPAPAPVSVSTQTPAAASPALLLSDTNAATAFPSPEATPSVPATNPPPSE
jgi:preprotein translocase subunit SecG